MNAVIFDVDGVLLDSPHERAWREALQELMTGEWRHLRSTWSPAAFTPQLYQRLVSGKPRLDGALATLEHFRVPYLYEQAQRYADRKQEHLTHLVEHGALRVYADARRFVQRLDIPMAAASSSRNAPALLRRAGFAFDADVSGQAARGKPAPDLFLLAADALGVKPEHCTVIEDAPAGIEAARAGGMRAIGIARHGEPLDADVVVRSLDELVIAGGSRGGGSPPG
jgi:HAD superfamily hydrolase (TIGR01509 family)